MDKSTRSGDNGVDGSRDIPSVQNMGISYTQKLGISFDTYPRHERYVYKLSTLFVYKVSEPVAL